MAMIYNCTVSAVGTSTAVNGLSGDRLTPNYDMHLTRAQYATLTSVRATKYVVSGSMVGGATFQSDPLRLLGAGEHADHYLFGP